MSIHQRVRDSGGPRQDAATDQQIVRFVVSALVTTFVKSDESTLINNPMAKFIKYCDEKYNIKLGCSTIQIGILAYYRNMDTSFSIADLTEQSEVINIETYNSIEADQKNKKPTNWSKSWQFQH
jgi:hypothetical protein